MTRRLRQTANAMYLKIGKVLSVRLPVPQSVLRDDELLNIRRAFDDLVRLGVSVVALNREFSGIAVGTEHLQRASAAKAVALAPLLSDRRSKLFGSIRFMRAAR